VKLIKREKGNPAGWKDTLTIEMSGWEFRVLQSTMGYVSSEYDALDTIRLGFEEKDAEAVSDALDAMDADPFVANDDNKVEPDATE
jgi:hypothetical protein